MVNVLIACLGLLLLTGIVYLLARPKNYIDREFEKIVDMLREHFPDSFPPENKL